MSAILFGSIGTLVDTSELQRRAFNESFEAHGLDWYWSRDQYGAMLAGDDGAQRIADYGKANGEADVDAAAVHLTKSQIFQELLMTTAIEARPGVIDTVHEAKRRDLKLGFVTTTSQGNINAVLAALKPHISAEMFDLIVHSDSVKKPNAASYVFALDQLGQTARSAVAIEDNVGGVAAATAAGIRCVAFPNRNTTDGNFSAAVEKVDALDAEQVVSLIASLTA
ncbi:MAG: HAD-IA family hydrolase [Mycobacterium sp.]